MNAMGCTYLPKPKSIDFLKRNVCGFYLESDIYGTPVLLLKFDASTIASVIRGCKIDIIIRNPNIESNCVALYIHDSEINPLCVIGNNFGELSSQYPKLDSIAFSIINSNKLIVALFNEYAICIHSFETEINPDKTSFEKWLINIETDPVFLNAQLFEKFNYDKENITTGFKVEINNKDHTEEEFINSYIYFKDRADIKSDTLGYCFKDYINNGKHGYDQENSITRTLFMFFDQNDYYVSPVRIDNTELTDFIIFFDDTVVLLESKCILSTHFKKQNDNLVKGVRQLLKAKTEILNKSLQLKDKRLERRLLNSANVFTICLHNDQVVLHPHNTHGLTDVFTKNDLPIFTSVLLLSELLTIFGKVQTIDFKYIFKAYLDFFTNQYMESTSDLFVLTHKDVEEFKDLFKKEF